jgi:hypothetical protein
MKTSHWFRSFAALPFFALCITAMCDGQVFGKDADGAQEKSLLRVAEVPSKPDSKKYELRYKLDRGDVVRYEVTHRASIHTTIEKTTEEAQTQTDSVKAWKVTDVLPEGDIEFTNVVEKVHMKNQLPDHDATEYDSTKDATPPAGYDDAAKAVGVPLSVMRITPQGKVIRRDMKVHNQGAEDDAPIVLRLPEKRVAIGDTWDEPFEIQVKIDKTNTKTIQTRRHHKLANVKNGIATIEVTYQVLSPIDAQIEMQMVQRLMQGEARFDIEKGRVIGQKMNIDKRIIGFAGPTSSMQYVMKMEESIIADDSKMATDSKHKASDSDKKPAPTSSKSAEQTATRPKSTSSNGKSYRR